MTTANNSYDFIDDMIDELGDETQAQKGFTAKTLPEGVGMARLIEYIECGQHQEMFQGQPKKHPSEIVRLTFEMSGKNFPAEIVDGKPVPFLLRLKLTKSLNEKSRYFKLFKILNWEQKYKHMAQLAAHNVGVKVKIIHDKKGEGADAKVYPTAYDKATGWTFSAPVVEDAETAETKMLNVPKATSPTRIFLFNKPRLQDWAALFIDGQKEDGTSKNWMQAEIRNAVNFPGSPLEALLAAGDLGEEPEEKAPPKKEAAEKPATAGKKVKGDDLGEI